MSGIHYNPKTGKTGECGHDPDNPRAKGCPFGENALHFTTHEEARKAFEESMSSKTLTSHKKNVRGDSIKIQDSEPIEIYYVHNPVSSKVYRSNQYFGQDIEPAGKYITAGTEGVQPPEGWQSGRVSFQKPLHLNFGGGYDEDDNWKKVLSEAYGGLKGKKLSQALRKDGYDAIFTHDKYGTSEIIQL